MIEAVYEIGKVQEIQNFLEEYIEDIGNNYKHIFWIQFEIFNTKIKYLGIGYEEYDGPLLEEVALYQAKSGEELIKDQIYSFTDRGERFVAIRPEMTPTLARMVAQSYRETPRPIRWFSIPNLMRYEKPQKGRLREHWQFNWWDPRKNP